MANQVDYRDPTPNNFPQDYDPAKVDPRVKLRSESIKHKQKGKHTREAMYQALEIGAVTANEAKTTADKTAESQDSLNQRVDDQIAANTIKDEEIDFRHSDMLKKTFETMRKRGDFYDQELANRKINVLWFGAAADGKTNDLNAVSDAITAAEQQGGGTVYFPKGDYNLSGFLQLKSHVNIEFAKGVNVYRTKWLVCWSRSLKPGYGGGVCDVTVTGGSFHAHEIDGQYVSGEASSINFALHHAQDITIKGAHFRHCTNPGHTLDLGGCDNVTVVDCIFEGSTGDQEYWYDEAIQVDNSTAGGESYNDPDNPSIGYDGIASRYVTVKDCVFKPSYNADGTIETYAPKPFGTHSAVGKVEAPHHLTFTNNKVIDVTPSTTNRLGGWLHFVAGNHIVIANNYFEQTNPVSTMAISFYQDAKFVDPAKAGELPMVWDITDGPLNNYETISVTGNQFIRFTQNVTGLIHFDHDSTLTGPHFNNVRISDNHLVDCFDDTGDTPDGATFAFVMYCRNVNLQSNQFNKIKKLLSAGNNTSITIADNTGDKTATGCIDVSNSLHVAITGNNIGDVTGTPIGIVNVANVNVANNIVRMTAPTMYEPHLISVNTPLISNVIGNILISTINLTSIIKVVGVTTANSMNLANNQYSGSDMLWESTSKAFVVHESNNNKCFT